jgi:hypothetical protein
MHQYSPCPACACHVKVEDARCPFCGADIEPAILPLPRPRGRMSRGQWLAFGSALSLIGCSATVPAEGSSARADGGDSVPIVVCTSRSGYFACGGEYCDRAIQACYNEGCAAYELAAPSCGPCPTCDCIGSAADACSDDGGTVTFSFEQTCYGAPPARLERLA